MQFNYKCSDCGKRFDISPEFMVCPICSGHQKKDMPLVGILNVECSGKIDKKLEIDIHDFLPVEREFFPKIPVGGTPLWNPERIGKKYGYQNFFVKDDSANPTGSLKDRASYLVSAFAAKFGIDNIALASTGNAGSSMAGIGAAAGQKITLFLPESAPPTKIIQALQYGAKVNLVAGNYDLAYDLSIEYSKSGAVLSRSTAYNPMTIEGKKTVSLEIFKQLGGMRPDHLFVPTGDGCILSGVYKGFLDLKGSGFITTIPTIHAVQAEGSNAIFKAYHTGSFHPVSSNTVADSISVDVPRNGFHALKQLKKYSGECMTVSDDQILIAQKELSEMSGLFVEPAAATAYAGFLKARNMIKKNETVVILATGNGLKDITSAGKMITIPPIPIRSIGEVK